MKPTMAISVWVLAAGLAVAQNPGVIQNTRATMNGVRDDATAASNAALEIQSTSAPSSAAHSPYAHKAGGGKGASLGAHHAKRPMHGVPVEAKVSPAPKVEPAGRDQKKIGEIVGNAAPTASDGTSPDDATASSKYNANGKRDPFLSPVVAHAGGPSCATGKKCLEIGAINLRGVVHAESGFIAVVSNSLNKAYFLRENDPVFNGYVVKITGDSIIFQETLQDRLGKSFTREVTKKITVPAV
jgi:hypothetical protein